MATRGRTPSPSASSTRRVAQFLIIGLLDLLQDNLRRQPVPNTKSISCRDGRTINMTVSD